MSEPISPKLQAELDHVAGVGVVVRYQFGDEVITQLMDEDMLENELWQDVAFTNGPPLKRIIIEFAPEEAAKLADAAAAERACAEAERRADGE